MENKRCKECDCELVGRKLAPKGGGKFRTVCRDCWNIKSRKWRHKHKTKNAQYTRSYNRTRRKVDKNFKAKTNKSNLKSNLKAIVHLKDSYIKNRLVNSHHYESKIPPEIIELKRLSIQIHRATK